MTAFSPQRFVFRGGELAIGSDSNVRIDAVEELRMLEYSQRLQQQLRGCLATQDGLGGHLWSSTAEAGARSLAMNAGKLEVGAMADIVVLNAHAPPLQGPRGQRALDALVTAGSRENIAYVYVGGRQRIKAGLRLRLDRGAILQVTKDELSLRMHGTAMPLLKIIEHNNRVACPN